MLDPNIRPCWEDEPPTPQDAPWCCPTTPVKNYSGPDEPGILCWIPDGCCGPSPCDIGPEDFICQIRSLLPEGDPYNNTAEPQKTPAPIYGAITVGCARVGCEQLVMGGCCGREVIPCEVDPVAPQLAVVDAFGAAAYGTLRALCAMLKELDPCTAERLIRKWAERMGIKHPDPCGPGWSEYILRFLICFLLQLRYNQRPLSWENLVPLAHRFGANIEMHYAGDMNCGPIGWWTMARDEEQCPPIQPCPPDPNLMNNPTLWPRGCFGVPLSLNIVMCPQEVVIPENCNVPTAAATLPHDPEMYEVFKWLLPQILPRGTFWCVYECNEDDCIPVPRTPAIQFS